MCMLNYLVEKYISWWKIEVHFVSVKKVEYWELNLLCNTKLIYFAIIYIYVFENSRELDNYLYTRLDAAA